MQPITMTVAAFSGVQVLPPDFVCYPNNGTADPSGVPAALTVWGGHEEFFQMAVQPEGNYAVAIATDFAFTMGLLDFSLNSSALFTYLWTRPSQSALYVSQQDITFGPRAVALETAWGVTAGWVQNNATKIWSAVAFLFAHSASSMTLLDRWQYVPPAGVVAGDRAGGGRVDVEGDSTTCRWP